MNSTSIVFAFGNALWEVPRKGGTAVRLTAGEGQYVNPFFSPDGKLIAFTADYDGNADVYVMPAEGGVPKRLTSHPDQDIALGWTPDGKSVLFESTMLSNTDYPRLFTVPVTGGFPTPLPLPSGAMGCYSPDGKRIAYVPHDKWELAWKRYRGGQTYPIWIADLSDSHVKPIPRDNTNDQQPVWVGNKIYYLSDKRGPVGLYCYDTSTGHETEEVKGEGFDIKSVTAGPDELVYEKLGGIYTFNPTTHESKRVPVEIHGDFLQVRPEFKDLQAYLESASISPTGARVTVAARGWVLTVPAKKGDVHQLDDKQGVHRRDAMWSPDAKTVAYITDEKGMEQVALFDMAASTIRFVDLGESPGFYQGLNWSPDSTKIAYIDNKRNMWMVDVKTGINTKVDSSIFNNPRRSVQPKWSPDSKWLTWCRDLNNHLNAVFVYSLDTAKRSQITDGLADADNAVFDRDGSKIYFTATTNIGQGGSWLDLSSFNALNPASSVYAVILKKDAPNPLQPESDEETPKPDAPAPTPAAPKAPTGAPTPPPAAKPAPAKLLIDLDAIEDRIIALPLPRAIYTDIEPGPGGSFFALSRRAIADPLDGVPGNNVGKFSFADREYTPFASGVSGMEITPDGSKALLGGLGGLSIVSTAAPSPPGTGRVNLSGLQVKIDPRAEWASMYHEVWRNERLLFYSSTLNGMDSVEMEKRYEPFLKNLCSREDLNYLFEDMLGELCVGHEFPGGGELAAEKSVPGGLLGADYTFDHNRYRFSRIYNGERWNPGLYAPLAQPGVNAKVGEYLLSVDGKDLTDSTDVYDALEGKAGKQVKIKIGPTSDGKGSREVTVVPVRGEFGLRQRAWEEDNRRYVDKATHGRGGYVHVPDTAEGGWEAFNRFYYSQVDHDGIVVDERFNHGGLINDFMIHEMQKPLDGAFQPRYGKAWPTPGEAIYGPKVMLINEMSGSGGDMFPWLFRHEHVGKLIGKRTWGGLIAAFGFQLVDGGHINSPDIAFFDPAANKWDVENWGVSPDEDVELDPFQWRQGKDAQLDAAIAELNKQLEKYTAPKLDHPPYPDRTKLGVRY